MDQIFVEILGTFPTFAGLVVLAYVLREELKAAREENARDSEFIKSLLITLIAGDDEKARSMARSELRSNFGDH